MMRFFTIAALLFLSSCVDLRIMKAPEGQPQEEEEGVMSVQAVQTKEKLQAVLNGRVRYRTYEEIADSVGTAVTPSSLSNDTLKVGQTVYRTPSVTFDIPDSIQGSFVNGTILHTRGFYAPGDGGGASYIVQSDSIAGYQGSAVKPLGANYAVLFSEIGVLCPNEFGAIEDDTLDDSHALNAMFNFGEKSGTSNFKFNRGNYIINSTVYLPDSLDVPGNVVVDGNGATLITDSSIVILSRIPADPGYSMMNNNAPIILNFKFDGNNIGRVGIRIGSMYGGVIKDCKFSSLDTAIHVANALKSEFSNNFFGSIREVSFLGESGVFWGASEAASQFNQNRIVGNRFYGDSLQSYDIYLKACNHNLVEGNVTEGYSPTVSEIYISTNTGTSKTNTVRNHWSEAVGTNTIILWHVGSGEVLEVDGIKAAGTDTIVKIDEANAYYAQVNVSNSESDGVWVKGTTRFNFYANHPETAPLTSILNGDSRFSGKSSWDSRGDGSEGARYIGNYSNLYLQTQDGSINVDNSTTALADNDINFTSGDDINFTTANSTAGIIEFRAANQDAGRITQLGGTRSAWAIGGLFSPSEAFHIQENQQYATNLKVENTYSGSAATAGVIMTSNDGSSYLRRNSITFSGSRFGQGLGRRTELISDNRMVIGTSAAFNLILGTNDKNVIELTSAQEVLIGEMTDKGAYDLQVDSSAYIGGQIVAPDHKQYGNTATSTDGSGDITVTFGTAFTASPSSITITSRGTTPYIFNVTARGTSSFTVRVFDTSGAAVLSTAMDFDWVAIR